jgi:hypothetical protein
LENKKNAKVFQNLASLDCIAFCDDDNEKYQRTYLDEINLNYMLENNLIFNKKPVHLDRLFENED